MGSAPPSPKEKKPAPSGPQRGMGEVLDTVASLSRKLDMVENRVNDLNREIRAFKESFVQRHNRITERFRTTETRMQEVQDKVASMESHLMTLVKEVKLKGDKEDVKMVKRYLELWNPVKFTTKEQVKRIVKDMLETEFK